ncbi:hypothetical protein CMV30_04310 [Nibricoccus aquaticus]|uniref:Uncharacterized protein n=2 Tax=Nibricoccus aquaticus TaxID=2576891 RepID=A0A290Q3J6_9BACT|nr:hypothetical protein CMV30_04310 [Nibricoccus aquaticus]
MNFWRWIPLVLVLPTFGFIAYWLWRGAKESGLGRLPKTRDEVKQMGDAVGSDFAAASKRLRRFNLWLFLAFFGAVIVNSCISSKG